MTLLATLFSTLEQARGDLVEQRIGPELDRVTGKAAITLGECSSRQQICLLTAVDSGATSVRAVAKRTEAPHRLAQ